MRNCRRPQSPGVLLASGSIAGGAITGIVIAAKELAGPLAAMGHRIEDWQNAHNPFSSVEKLVSDWSTAILAVGQAGILPAVARKTTGKMPVRPTGWKPVPRPAHLLFNRTNPFLNGPSSDLIALIPFVVLCVLLYLVGRDVLVTTRPKVAKN